MDINKNEDFLEELNVEKKSRRILNEISKRGRSINMRTNNADKSDSIIDDEKNFYIQQIKKNIEKKMKNSNFLLNDNIKNENVKKSNRNINENLVNFNNSNNMEIVSKHYETNVIQKTKFTDSPKVSYTINLKENLKSNSQIINNKKITENNHKKDGNYS